MSKDHLPDIEERWKQNLRSSDGTIPDHFVWLFSTSLAKVSKQKRAKLCSVNQEDLTTPKTLLVFLNSRGRMTPWEFAAIEMEFSPGLTVLFDGCTDQTLCTSITIDFTEAVDPSIYGKLNRNSEGSSERRRSDDKYSICARRAFQMLLIQQRILAYLLACARAILHDNTDVELLQSPVQETLPIIQIVTGTRTDHTSFTEVLNMAPY